MERLGNSRDQGPCIGKDLRTSRIMYLPGSTRTRPSHVEFPMDEPLDMAPTGIFN